MDKSYKQFVDKLNEYIRKYYCYQLIRGFILFGFLMIVYICFISLLEYFNYFNPKIKLTILIITIFITLFIFTYFLLIPLLKLSGKGKRLSYYDVSLYLKNTFPEIKDKLINVVELANENDLVYSKELKRASIDQKINELNVFKFSDAIRYKDLKLIFSLFFSVLLLVGLIFIFSPDFFTESSIRLIHFNQQFIKPAPYTFVLENKQLKFVTGESIELKLNCVGKNLPAMMYVNIGGNNFLMKYDGKSFRYTIENLNSSILVYFTDNQYISEVYNITVLNKPFISFFSVEIKPPSYTNLNTETFQNIGDFKIASGTQVKWVFTTVDTDSLYVELNDSSKILAIRINNLFEVSHIFYKDSEYKIAVKNAKLNSDNNLVYKIQIIPDLFPEIRVVQVRDSSDFKNFIFKGNIIDDYGFNQLDFTISSEGKDSIFKIPFTPFLLNQNFYYSFNFESVRKFGQSFKYYFSVYDNDIVNHFKRTISETFTFSFPDYKDIVSKENSELNSIDKLLQKSTSLTEEIQKDFRDFKMKQINSQISEWEKLQSVKDIMNKKTELENVLEQINQKNKEANKFLNSFSEEKSEIVKKQEQIEKLLDEVFSDELKKLFNEFNDLAKQFDSKQFDKLSKEMDSGLGDLSKQLDKNMQLLKRMKVEQKVERIIAELKKLSESEKSNLEKLVNRTDLIQTSELEKVNNSLFKNLISDYSNAMDYNKTLDKPLNLFGFDNEFSNISDNYKRVISDAENKNKRKTSSGIESNIKDMNQLVFAMDQMLKNNKQKQNSTNVEDLKQILKNLILLSFNQERVLNKLTSIDFNNPLVNDLKLIQKNIIGQVVFIKDSLYALSKRTPEISSVINKEMLALETNANFSFDNLEGSNIGGSRMYQQYGITAANNLSLFLSEALENIKNQQKSSGDGDCDKPGGKGAKPGMKSLKDSQSSIKDQLQKMIDQMKTGDLGKLSKSIGQTLAQQEIMQQMIRDMLNGGSVGSKAKDQLKAIDQLLEQSRKDLINKKINNELINRQNLILSKLLDAEKSETERDFEDKRESKTAIEMKKSNPESYFEYKSKLKNEDEFIKRTNNKLKSFYDQKYNNFLNSIK